LDTEGHRRRVSQQGALISTMLNVTAPGYQRCWDHCRPTGPPYHQQIMATAIASGLNKQSKSESRTSSMTPAVELSMFLSSRLTMVSLRSWLLLVIPTRLMTAAIEYGLDKRSKSESRTSSMTPVVELSMFLSSQSTMVRPYGVGVAPLLGPEER